MLSKDEKNNIIQLINKLLSYYYHKELIQVHTHIDHKKYYVYYPLKETTEFDHLSMNNKIVLYTSLDKTDIKILFSIIQTIYDNDYTLFSSNTLTNTIGNNHNNDKKNLLDTVLEMLEKEIRLITRRSYLL